LPQGRQVGPQSEKHRRCRNSLGLRTFNSSAFHPDALSVTSLKISYIPGRLSTERSQRSRPPPAPGKRANRRLITTLLETDPWPPNLSRLPSFPTLPRARRALRLPTMPSRWIACGARYARPRNARWRPPLRKSSRWRGDDLLRYSIPRSEVCHWNHQPNRTRECPLQRRLR